MTRTLSTKVHDSTNRIMHLFDNLKIIFAAAGLHNPSADRFSPSVSFKEARSAPSVPGPTLVNTNWIRRPLVPSPHEPLKLEIKESLAFDPRDLLCTFKNFVWAEKIRLERLSICRLGLAKHIQRAGSNAQLQEECSVPLFQVAEGLRQGSIIMVRQSSVSCCKVVHIDKSHQ